MRDRTAGRPFHRPHKPGEFARDSQEPEREAQRPSRRDKGRRRVRSRLVDGIAPVTLPERPVGTDPFRRVRNVVNVIVGPLDGLFLPKSDIDDFNLLDPSKRDCADESVDESIEPGIRVPVVTRHGVARMGIEV